MPEHQAAQRREDDAAWAGTLEKGAADQRLGALDLRADRRLGQAELGAGP
jgi:hypothetical protein